MRDTSFSFMIIARILFLIAILWQSIIGNATIALFNSAIFLITLPLCIVGWRRKKYRLPEISITAIFLAAMIISLFIPWTGDLFSYDKIFHMAGGAWAAGFAAVLYARQFRNPLLLYPTIILTALAVGAGWEVFEWLLSILPGGMRIPGQGFADSMLDIIADTVGAAIIAGILYLKQE